MTIVVPPNFICATRKSRLHFYSFVCASLTQKLFRKPTPMLKFKFAASYRGFQPVTPTLYKVLQILLGHLRSFYLRCDKYTPINQNVNPFIRVYLKLKNYGFFNFKLPASITHSQMFLCVTPLCMRMSLSAGNSVVSINFAPNFSHTRMLAWLSGVFVM